MDFLKYAIPGYGAYQVGKKVVKKVTDESQGAIDQRDNMNNQSGMASAFADQGQQGYGALGQEAQASRDYLRRVATGQEPSVAGEQLRQGLQQNMSAQRSMAASAAPGNQAMAARSAANNMNRAGIGMSGQAALAGMQERQAAQQALADMILKQRQQDMQVALGSRQTAISGYGGITPAKSFGDKYLNAISAGAGLASKAK